MVAEFNAVYQRAIYYDIVFKRDVSREVQFIHDVFQLYAGRELRSVLDVACGPGYHARAFAGQGLRAVGLDLRGEMLQFAADEAEKEGVSVDWLEADMRCLTLDEPVDAALAMFDGIDALLSNEDLIAHFQSIAANLTPGGIYLLDMSHPSDYTYKQYARYYYTGKRDGIEVEILWATNRPLFDYSTSTALVEIEMRVNHQGEAIIIHDTAMERLLTGQEIRLLAQLSGALTPVGWYGDFKLTQPLDHTPATQRMIIVLQKTGGV